VGAGAEVRADVTAMDSAADAWREGRIVDARREYERIVDQDPDDWGARFQLAWLDAVFGRLTPERIQALERPGLSDSARRVLQALHGMTAYPVPLEGNEDDWDIAALRKRGGHETYSSWWERRGKAATEAGLYGVASACLEEAERREPNGAYWDPPSWTHSLPALLDNHLELVGHPFA
jgi:tetratricopeptide (TPR) repeat protein